MSNRWNRRVRPAAVLLIVGALALAACGGDDDDSAPTSVDAAQKAVDTAQTKVDEAQSKLDAATTQFCADSTDYTTAIDRYGGLFVDSAATVGDVTTGGKDLAAPREAVKSSANGVVEARDELTQAQQELADAQASLAEAQSGTTGPDAPDVTPTTLLPPATIDRVAQAEADLASVTSGISADTPLATAGTQFNAAAFSLEVAWLRVLYDGGCLSDAQEQQAVSSVIEYTTALQTALSTTKYYSGDIDGIYGPQTSEAVSNLQKDAKLPVTGLVDQATSAALEAAVLGVSVDDKELATAQTGAVQSTLKLTGYWTGPVDGKWTPELSQALMAFQTDLGVPPTGAIDPPTLDAIKIAITEGREARAAASTTTTTAASTTTTAAVTTTTGAP